MDTQTRHALKQDALLTATSSSIGWLQTNRDNVIRLSIAVVAVLAIAIIGTVVYVQRSAAAQAAFGHAMDTYSTPLAQPGVPAEPGATTYPTSAARAKDANAQFLAVADHYGMLEPGTEARYFAGLTYMDMGNTSAAETSLKQVASGHNRNLAALAKSALAGLYHQTNRDSEAIQLYQDLIAHPTDTVPASSAKLQLAELYEPTRPADARKLYAEIQDKDKTTAASQIAAERLRGPNK